jgi:hypothetical protein
MNAMCVITRLEIVEHQRRDNQYQHVLNSCVEEQDAKTPKLIASIEKFKPTKM